MPFVFLLVAAALSGPASALTIPEAKLLADNEPVTLDARCVTYAAADFFYVEEDSRAAGIRVEKPAHGLTPGMRADVAGTMKTNTARERYILATSAVQNGEGSIEPVGMTYLNLGGENWHVDGTSGQKGVSGAMGLNNIGLLVRIWGAYEKLDDTTFTVDDGSGPVRCTAPAGTTLGTAWQYVAVTGISSVWKMTNTIFPPLLLVRDITNTYDPPDTTEMVHIPAGGFLMGNNGGEPYSSLDELPQHSVYLSGYWIGKYAVTRGEYRRFMEATGHAAPAYWDAVQDWGTGSFTQTDDHPVVGVTWYDAEAYCAWAGGHLPTEAQWEKAARWTGSYPNVYPWGNAWDAEKCNNWYDHNAAGGGYKRYQTAPVGSYPSGASPYGLQDMAGNVWEWVADWYVSYPGSPSPFDYTGSYRVLRGGSWGVSDNPDRCAGRGGNSPSNGWNYFGFRLAR